jgi:outer membrane protein assembly factor BamB
MLEQRDAFPHRLRRLVAILVVVLGMSLVIPAARIGADGAVPVWPMFHHDSAHTGLSAVNTAGNSGTLKWQYVPSNGSSGGTAVMSSPAIGADRTIYFGASNGNIYALDPAGSLKWEYGTARSIQSSPAVGPDGAVYIGSDDGNVYALNPDGSLKWKSQMGFSVTSSPAIGRDGTVYVTGLSVSALDPTTGVLKWQFQSPRNSGTHGSPAVGADGTIYVVADDCGYSGCATWLYALNPDGTVKWRAGSPNGGPLVGGDSYRGNAPAIAPDGTIYVTPNQGVGSCPPCFVGVLTAMSPSGTPKWTLPTGAAIENTPAIGADGTVYLYSSDSTIYAVNPDGTVKWRFPTGSWSESSPAIGADGTIYVGDQNGRLYALNPDGSLRWVYSAGVVVESSPAIDVDGTIYVGTGDPFYSGDQGSLLALNNANAVSHITPNTGGNAGQVTVTAVGSGFGLGATAMLSGGSGPSVSGTDVRVSPDGRSLTVTFDLTGQPPGARDFVVTDSTGSSTTLPGGFTVESGGGSNVQFHLFGPSYLRAGEGRTYYASFTNTGLVNAPGAVAFVTIPASIQVESPLPVFRAPDGTQTVLAVASSPDLPPGGFYNVPLRLNVPDIPAFAHQNFMLAATWSTGAEAALPQNDTSVRMSLVDASSDGSSAQLVTQVTGATATGDLSLHIAKATVPTASPSTLTVSQSAGETTLTAQFTEPDGDPIQWSVVVRSASDVWEALRKWALDAYGAISQARDVAAALKLLAETTQMTTWLEANGYITSDDAQTLLTDVQNMDDWELHVEAPGLVACLAAQEGPASQACSFAQSFLGLFRQAGIGPYLGHLGDALALQLSNLDDRCNNGDQVACDLVAAIVRTGEPSYNAQFAFLAAKRDFLHSKECAAGPGARLRAARESTCAPPQSGSATLEFQSITSGDPNDLTGPPGAGSQRWVSGSQPLGYDVFFSNEPTASAPGQTVKITDQLDVTSVDPSTASLGPITFGEHVLTPPPGATSFSGTVDLRPAVTLAVQVAAEIDRKSGLITWTYTSIDPTTGNPPTDPTSGFLPPDSIPPNGEGDVLFSVMPRAGLSTGTTISNQATVTFDVNPPIDTAVWRNSVDATPPVSEVQALPATESTAHFLVSWSGTDVGSGIAGYTIWVSEDGGPFTIWLDNTPQTSATYPGVVGHAYAFFSIAEDNAGNVEPAKSVPEATTKTVTTPTTTVTRPPCAAPGCLIAAAETGDACARQAIPPRVARELARGLHLFDEAQASGGRRARRLRRLARHTFKQAKARVLHAGKGKKATLSRACVEALVAAIEAAAAEM